MVDLRFGRLHFWAATRTTVVTSANLFLPSNKQVSSEAQWIEADMNLISFCTLSAELCIDPTLAQEWFVHANAIRAQAIIRLPKRVSLKVFGIDDATVLHKLISRSGKQWKISDLVRIGVRQFEPRKSSCWCFTRIEKSLEDATSSCRALKLYDYHKLLLSPSCSGLFMNCRSPRLCLCTDWSLDIATTSPSIVHLKEKRIFGQISRLVIRLDMLVLSSLADVLVLYRRLPSFATLMYEKEKESRSTRCQTGR
ncbi:hypothetical protein T12_5890 [Trichinella patagoniensis]|uniref:Uncharacterized protein n=1 Tax=Trichinella patagoniensis TaxID=990121 RepID=A0A0V1A1K7_9BILA|nr:hypothetical protein T12_5890 [Trichinella patagoniensis]